MREILFKAKRIDNGEWVSGGSLITFLDNGVKSFFIPQFNETCICEHDEKTDDILSFSECRFYKVDPETLCQFTGIHDKNGNKIWENDIVDTDHYATKAHVVKYNYGSFYVGINGLLFHYNNVSEVIGNIFDNPELLEGE